MSTPEKQSYISPISKLAPWSGRSPSSKPVKSGQEADITALHLGAQHRGADHVISHRRALSVRNYPPDCPQAPVRWFFATDAPKRKPKWGVLTNSPPTKPPPAPKKWAAFSENDSRAIESTFQKIVDAEHEAAEQSGSDSRKRARSMSGSHGDVGLSRHKKYASVPVNEDYLFDVDVEERELAPAYWPGPVYDVKRGSWFHQEGNVQRPCDENLATQLEEGFLKTRPWRFGRTEHRRSVSQPRTLAVPPGIAETQSRGLRSMKPKGSVPNLRDSVRSKQKTIQPLDDKAGDPPEATQANSHRLFGPYSNSIVTYQDNTTAWILTDDLFSRMSSTMYGRFAGGSHLAGSKVTRGYVDLEKKAETKDETVKEEAKTETDEAVPEQPQSPTSEIQRRNIEEQMTSLVNSATMPGSSEQQEEEVRRRDEREIQDDYREQDGAEQEREIEHLVLVTHGIGQRLGLRMESVNFVHDVNTFRKTLKSVYGQAPDLQALNSEVDKELKNCRVQVLPIIWRHKLDFPKQSLRHNRKEHDLGDVNFAEEDEYPNLDDITVDGVPAVRNLITDLALDILLYQSPAYKGHISRIVVEECNRIYKLFSARNPNFRGKVSLVGHSLGSAILFDILCAQKDEASKRLSSIGTLRKDEVQFKLDFDVEDFYALGSPIGLFQMLNGRVIAARDPKTAASGVPLDLSDSVLSTAANALKTSNIGEPGPELPTSSPRCRQLFNIFHPTDPISYRLEPLISSAMASLKPQPLPYTKRGIFGSQVGQGLTGIGNRVGQSVSGLWSSFSSGIASSLLNRSLGISAEDETKLRNQTGANAQSRGPLSMTAVSPAISSKSPMIPSVNPDNGTAAIEAGEDGQHPPTLIDLELQTLYAGFQKRRKSATSEDHHSETDSEWTNVEDQERKMKREEAKVRALNANGRVDYSIQEGAFDISVIAAVASHLSYWADEDVSHFMISQLLSRQRVVKRRSSSVQS